MHPASQPSLTRSSRHAAPSTRFCAVPPLLVRPTAARLRPSPSARLPHVHSRSRLLSLPRGSPPVRPSSPLCPRCGRFLEWGPGTALTDRRVLDLCTSKSHSHKPVSTVPSLHRIPRIYAPAVVRAELRLDSRSSSSPTCMHDHKMSSLRTIPPRSEPERTPAAFASTLYRSVARHLSYLRSARPLPGPPTQCLR